MASPTPSVTGHRGVQSAPGVLWGSEADSFGFRFYPSVPQGSPIRPTEGSLQRALEKMWGCPLPWTALGCGVRAVVTEV